MTVSMNARRRAPAATNLYAALTGTALALTPLLVAAPSLAQAETRAEKLARDAYAKAAKRQSALKTAGSGEWVRRESDQQSATYVIGDGALIRVEATCGALGIDYAFTLANGHKGPVTVTVPGQAPSPLSVSDTISGPEGVRMTYTYQDIDGIILNREIRALDLELKDSHNKPCT